jgi:hypothetical protein
MYTTRRSKKSIQLQFYYEQDYYCVGLCEGKLTKIIIIALVIIILRKEKDEIQSRKASNRSIVFSKEPLEIIMYRHFC